MCHGETPWKVSGNVNACTCIANDRGKFCAIVSVILTSLVRCFLLFRNS